MGIIRILQIVNYMDRGGLETMLMNYYRHLDTEKIQFDFLVHRKKRADFDDEIESMGGKIYRMPRLNPISLRYNKEEMSFFKNHKYQIVHCHMDCMSAFPLGHAKRVGIPIRIAHSHSKDQNKDLKYPIKMFCKQLIPFSATHFFACGTEAGRFMFGKRDFHIMKNAIDINDYLFNILERRKVRTELGIEDNIVLGNVANFTPAKNHSFLLDVFYRYHKVNKKSKLLLIGDGPNKGNIEKKIEKLGLQEAVILTGVRKDVNRLLQAMDVFVFPSIYEGLPVTMVEAQTAGLPCVISENVPKETDITNLVTRISLDASLSHWVAAIEDARKIKRKNQSDKIRESGFDIRENVKKLEEFYIKVYKQCVLRF